MRTTPDSTLLTVVLEDFGALIGLAFAAGGLTMTLLTGDSRWDAAASMAIGCTLGVLAFILGGRAHSLLIGQAADTHTLDLIDRILCHAPFVERVVDSYTTQLSPENLILAAHVQVNEDLTAQKAGALVACLEEQLIEQIPALQHIFIEIEPSVVSAKACPPWQDMAPTSEE
ncbi:Cation efflux family protein [compost metagenome]